MTNIGSDAAPMLSAVSGSARQLYVLLRCISFGSKIQVQPTEDGIRFSAEDSNVMEGMVFLNKTLFTSYRYHPPPAPTIENDSQHSDDEQDGPGPFSISMQALLETLQIFGLTDQVKPNSWMNRDSHRHDAFSAPMLGVSGICRLRYDSTGSPLMIVLEEPGISTTCELVTYEPNFTSDIPFARDDLAMKIIMGGSYLSDALSELAASSPDRLTIVANDKTLTLSAKGDHGSALISFHRDAKKQWDPSTSITNPSSSMAVGGAESVPGVLETFAVPSGSFNQSYKFAHILATKRALMSAIKVSIRGDAQGVLSLQFMIQNLEGAGVSFVDYRFVPLIREDEEDDEDIFDTNI